MSSSKSIIVNCGASHVSYTVINRKGSKLVVEELHIETLNYDYSDEEAWMSALTAAMRIILAKAKTKGDATLIAPGYQLLTKTIKVPKVEPEKQSQIIAFEAQQNIPYPLGEVVWGHQVIADDGVEAEVILIAFKSVAAIRFCNVMNSLGIRPVSVQASSVLDFNAFNAVYPGNEESTLFINIGARTSSMLFISPDGFVVRNIAIGGNTLTQNIADQLGRTFLKAEQLKVGIFSGTIEYDANDASHGTVWQAAEVFIRRMTQEIARSLVNYKRSKKSIQPSMILLTGRGALIPGFSEQLSQSQQMVVDYFNPTQVVTGANNKITQSIMDGFAQLSEVVGQACRADIPTSVGVELLPPSIRSTIDFKKKRPFMMVAAICLAVAPLPALIHYQGASGEYDKKKKEVVNSIPAFTGRHKNILENQKKSEVLFDRIRKLETLSKSRSNWLTFFADIQDRLASVKDVWLDSLEVLREPVSGANTGAAHASSGSSQAASSAVVLSAETPANYRLKISGRMLLRGRGNEKGLDPKIASQRVRQFIDSIKESEFIKSQDGDPKFPPEESNDKVLKFYFTLIVNPDKPL